MKVVYVYPHFVEQAGTERVLIDKMNYLASVYNYEIFMVTNEQGNHPISYPLYSSVNHVDLNVRFSPLYKRNRFVRLFKWFWYNKELKKRFNLFISQVKPDIVVSITYHSNWISIVGNCKYSYVRILESHIDKRFILNNDPLNQKSLFRWTHTLCQMKTIDKEVKNYDILVALTPEDAADWSRYVKSIVIQNVVHLNETGKHSDQNSKRVIFAGRYTEQKGLLELFEIWKLVYLRHPDWHLDLYGSGHLCDNLKAEANRLQMNINVHEPDNNIFDRYLESSIFVLSSVYEPFGLVIPEAMSCGLPVVAFDCPYGPANIIKDGETGFLISNRDKEAFAEKICFLIESPSLRQEMGKSAIKSSQFFSAENIMPQWKDLFEKLVEEHRR